MTAEVTTGSLDYREILQQAVQAYRSGSSDRPKSSLVVEALLQAETAAKRQRLQYPFEGLAGEWRLCYTTGVKKKRRGGISLGKGFYLPSWTPACIGFEPQEQDNQAQISNQIQVSGLTLRFTGPARYLDRKNLLAFDFNHLQILLGNRSLYQGGFSTGKDKTSNFDQRPIGKLPFFAFFLITDELIAARGRGGGLALWLRQ